MLITVFTPAYNRGHLLHRVYESLCKQTFKDFEWVVVDDGSKEPLTTNRKPLTDIQRKYIKKCIFRWL